MAAGVVPFSDAVRLVRLRGQYMQEAVPAGSWRHGGDFGLEDAIVEQACRQAGELGIVVPVNFNSLGRL